MMRPRLACATIAGALGALGAVGGGEEPPRWPRWRGPEDNAVVAAELPIHWSAASNLAWRIALPGRGASTPVVWDDRIVLTTQIDHDDGVLAFDISGGELWRVRLGPARAPRHQSASSCNPSPVTDGRKVWVYFKSGTLAALTLDGRLVWRTSVEEQFGRDELVWDIGTSPVLTSNHVVVSVMNGPRSHLAAWDRDTGRPAWSVPRAYPCAYEADQGYTTPIVLPYRGREAILVWNAEHVTLHDARDGAVIWDCGGLNPEGRSNWPPVASPALADGMVVVPYGRGQRLFGLALTGEGDVTATAHRWMRSDIGSYVPTPLVWQGRLYLLRDRHEIDCIDPSTGQTLWTGLFERNASPFYASPLIAGGRLYAAREDGVVFVAQIDGAFRLLARNAMGERIWASPAPLGRRLLLRGERTLFCVGPRMSTVLPAGS